VVDRAETARLLCHDQTQAAPGRTPLHFTVNFVAGGNDLIQLAKLIGEGARQPNFNLTQYYNHHFNKKLYFTAPGELSLI
jgi:hypothetical protein